MEHSALFACSFTPHDTLIPALTHDDILRDLAVSWTTPIAKSHQEPIRSATCLRTRRAYAIKALKDSVEARREAALHSKLAGESSHIIPLSKVYLNSFRPQSSSFASPHLFMVMECAHMDLFSLVDREGPLSERQTKTIIRQLVQALATVHAHDIVHRDIKPENILLDHSLNVKLTDFGYAAVVGTTPAPVCTPAFASPEAMTARKMFRKGAPAPAVSKETDLWSVGATMYFMLAARHPFGTRFRTADDVEKLLLGQVSFNHSVWNNVSADCKRVVQALMTTDATARMTLEQLSRHPWLVDSTP
jgi:serine/threonine protein kinase